MINSRPLVQELPTEQNIDGASGARLFSFEAHAKGNSSEFPYNVVNEKIASELARLIGLPVPEVLLYQHRDEWLFFSRSVAPDELISGEERDFLMGFLSRRQTQMESIVRENAALFPHLTIPSKN